MLLWVVRALAGEESVVGEGTLSVPGLDTERVFPWSEVGFAPAVPESAAFGPDHLAVGPGGRWALWDPVDRLVRTDTLALAMDHVDSLGFAADGDLLVLNTTSRTLSRWQDGELVDAVPMDRLCPSQVSLVVDGELVVGADVFGNLHPLGDLTGGRLDLADAPRLLPPAHRVGVTDGVVRVDGQETGVTGAVSARMVGAWVVVELGRRGAISARIAVSLDSGRRVALPSSAGAKYRPADALAADAEGGLAWLDPQADGLHLHRVSP